MRDDGANVVIIMILTKKTGKKVQKSNKEGGCGTLYKLHKAAIIY